MDLDRELAHALRFLAVDAIHLANSGHPGMPLGMAEIATVLWLKHLKHDPSNPEWFDRDRFILSNGHGSMLLYALLHLSGYDLTIDDIKQFRQLSSKTPGHPELMPGVETTTGPLGQGLANAVGMALAEKLLSQKYNTQNQKIIDHNTYVFVGDGCLMEGISHEVSSFAGHHKLGKLIVFWDNNSITIDGSTELSVSDSVEARFEAYGWQVVRDVDGHDMQAIDAAIVQAKANTDSPTLIACKTVIGFGSDVAGLAKAHGSPMGASSIKQMRQDLGWEYDSFELPDAIYNTWNAIEKGAVLFANSQDSIKTMQQDDFASFTNQMNSNFVIEDQLELAVKEFSSDMATRQSSNCFLKAFANKIPGLIGGSADLTPSVLTKWPDANNYHINYGVREFGMFAIMSGLNLHGGFIAFGGTFLTFIDYGRSAIRMSAMMHLRQIYVLTHDSIGLGEDGPTHQPVEHLSILRATPGLETWRPCDTWETFIAWSESLKAKHPSALVLSRQTLPALVKHKIEDIKLGAYVCLHADVPLNKLHAIILATGSEVHIAVEAAIALAHDGIMVRVVSMPCMDRFLEQDETVKEKVLPNSIKVRLAVEAGAAQSWWRLVGDHGKVISIDCYGDSAPAKALFKKFGFTKENIMATLCSMLEENVK